MNSAKSLKVRNLKCNTSLFLAAFVALSWKACLHRPLREALKDVYPMLTLV